MQTVFIPRRNGAEALNDACDSGNIVIGRKNKANQRLKKRLVEQTNAGATNQRLL